MSEPVLTPKVDRITGSALIIDHAENDVHEGKSFKFHFESSAPFPTDIGEETAVGFITPAAELGFVHLSISVTANDESVWQLREDPGIVLDSGTEFPTHNRNRISPNTSGVSGNTTAGSLADMTGYNVLEADTAGLAGGAVLHSETIAIGGVAPFGSVTNEESRDAKEWILKADTEYVIIVTSSTVNTTAHQITLDWSEDIPSDFVN